MANHAIAIAVHGSCTTMFRLPGSNQTDMLPAAGLLFQYSPPTKQFSSVQREAPLSARHEAKVIGALPLERLRSHSVMVITLDFDESGSSSNVSSNLTGSFHD